MRLEDIKDPSFLKKLSFKELNELAVEIRSFLLSSIPETGGHLSSNLGTVELIIALHYVFNSPEDALIFDVGHQAYTHKILTGRMKYFDKLRQTDGLSGYIDYTESVHDQWESGHAGTALSALMGLLYAKDIKGESGEGIAIVGDASIVNGMSFEALNLLGSDTKHRGIIILNDNEMSISRPVGAISNTLTRIRSAKTFRTIKKLWVRILPRFILGIMGRLKRSLRSLLQRQNVFEDLGYMYIGPMDGHDIKSLVKTLRRVKHVKKSVVLHVITDKGKGHPEAEIDTVGKFHGISNHNGHKPKGISWSELIAHIMDKLQDKVKTFVVMPAMTVGTKMEKFQKKYPDRYIDIGIAEEHGATMCAMLAHRGVPVYYPIYATFSQRAFDQILNDIARSDHHVVFGVDRAGIIGEDGSTHQGLFDVSMFGLMPNMVISMPYDAKEAANLIHYAFLGQSHPMVVRYPKGQIDFNVEQEQIIFEHITQKWTVLKDGKGPVLISYGPALDLLIKASEIAGVDTKIINARFIKPIDQEMMDEICKDQQPICVYEEASNYGGLYPQILNYMAQKGYKNDISSMSITDQIVTFGQYEDMLKYLHMDIDTIAKRIKEMHV